MAPVRIPGVSYAAAPSAEASAKTLAWPPKLVVIHDTGNPTSTKENEASYAHTRPVKGATSAHAYIDNGGVLGSLRLDRQAWAAYGYANANGLHLEMCLRGDRTRTRQITAALTRQLCQMAGIPMVKLTPAQVAAGARGVCGHRDITIGLRVGDHADPGIDFPWSQFMTWVNASPQGVSPVSVLEPNEQRQLANVDEYAYGIAGELDPLPKIKGGSGLVTPVPNLPLQRAKRVEDKLDQLLARPAGGPVTPTPEQWAALTASITTTLETLFAQKVGEAAELAAEAAIRRVLGGLDGATPPAA